MAELSVEQMSGLLKDLFRQEEGPRMLLEALTEQAMEVEASQHVGAERHQRCEDRRGHRNGYKPRQLHTRVGTLSLQVPQVRNTEPYQPSFWNKWQRHEQALLEACAEMYFQGVSTRKVQEVLTAMCQGEISAMTVSRIAAELDQKLQAFRQRSLRGIEWPYLQIDARYEHVRIEGRIVSQAVLVVIGFNGLGRREILDWCVADSESQSTWGELFRRLKDRGLSGLLLVTSDAHRGIQAALERHFQGVGWQRCQVHFARELGRKVSRRLYHPLQQDLRAVWQGSDRAECLRRGQEMASRWGKNHPGVARQLEEGLESCLTVLSFPAEHRRHLKSTNLAESLMRVLRRRTAVVGIFPSVGSADRLVGALLLETHEQWLTAVRPFLNMAELSRRCVPSAAAVA